MDAPETPYAHFDQPAFEHMRMDHSISRAAIFFICFLTVGVFLFAIVSLPVARLVPVQQLQQLGQLGTVLTGGSSTSGATSTALDSSKPSGPLGATQQEAASPAASSQASSPAASASAVTDSAPASSAARATASASASPSAAASGGSYVVQSGDTLSGLARRFNTTVQAIANANKISDTTSLRVGQRLVIPGQ